jgi:long-chain acyl-CoA synthetase
MATMTELVARGNDTVPKLFWAVTQDRGNSIAMTEKEHGIWKAVTWAEYGERARTTGLGLMALGLQAGELINILSETIPEWLYADMGALGCGAISVGIYPTCSRDQVSYIVNDSGAVYIFVEDEEQLDKVLERRDQLPKLRRVIVFDMEGLRHFSDPMVISYDQLLEMGARYGKEHPGAWEERVRATEPQKPAIFVYTSGTTGPPKGAMLSNANILFMVDRFSEAVATDENDQTLAFLPLCHMAERLMTAFRPLGYGGTVNFAESPDTVLENLREISPTVFFAVPRIWEKLHSLVTVTLMDATPLQRWAYARGMAIGYRVAELRLARKPVPAWLSAAQWIANKTALRNVRKLVGLDKARLIGSGAAPISSEVLRWFMALNIPVIEMYGQTECSGLATATTPATVKLGTVGRALGQTELKVTPDGDILVRGPHVFLGYHNKPEKTAETIDKDGWLHTGDVGVMDSEGYLRITDRKSDIIITSGGKNITPTEIENKLKFSPYITDAVIIGDRRNYLTALVMIDHDNVAKWAQDHRVNFTDYRSLTRANEVKELIQAEVDKVNTGVANVERVRKFTMIDVLLTAEDEEMTPTLKLRRKYVNEKYKELIDNMYKSAA